MRLRRNRRVLAGWGLPAFVGLVVLAVRAESIGALGLPLMIAGAALLLFGTWPLWMLLGAPLFGVRPCGIVLGAGRFLSARAPVAGATRIRRSSPGSWGVVSVADAGTAQWRMWLGYAVPVVLQLGLAWVLWRSLPEGIGTALGFGMIIGLVLLYVVFTGVAPAPGWMLFRLPTADRHAVEQVTYDATEGRATRAVLVGDLAELRAVLAESATSRPYTVALRCELALAEGRYAEAAAIATEHGPGQIEGSIARAALGQDLVRARWYAQEALGPRSSVAPSELVEPMAEGLSWVLADPYSDALALYWLACGDAKRAHRAAVRARSTVVGPHAAAHLECTIALVETVRDRPVHAAKALANARALAPDMPRIAAAERWCAPGAAPLGPHAVSAPVLE